MSASYLKSELRVLWRTVARAAAETPRGYFAPAAAALRLWHNAVATAQSAKRAIEWYFAIRSLSLGAYDSTPLLVVSGSLSNFRRLLAPRNPFRTWLRVAVAGPRAMKPIAVSITMGHIHQVVERIEPTAVYLDLALTSEFMRLPTPSPLEVSNPRGVSLYLLSLPYDSWRRDHRLWKAICVTSEVVFATSDDPEEALRSVIQRANLHALGPLFTPGAYTISEAVKFARDEKGTYRRTAIRNHPTATADPEAAELHERHSQ